jgi:2-oxoglutarate dehydrogenase E1 component
VGGPDDAVPEVDTAVARDQIAELGRLCTKLPDGFHPHPKIARLLTARQAMTRGELPLDWATGEMLAFGSLLQEGFLVRLSGQDSSRGTFSQRHAIVTDIETGAEYMPLGHLGPNQGEARIYDSALSEAAVLGFEFGYSLDYPDGLIMWEAQFGDFVNGAQVIIDQFISSSEDKWKRISGLTMLLPHGFEGQGPEHSSARFERFLQLCAEDNIQVVNPTTPANYFHVLRRQIHRKWRKPLVILTPKSLLRHPDAVSRVDDFARGGFQRVLFDPAPPPADQVRRVVICSGKIYYDLAAERKKRDDRATAIVRLEQIYPWRDELVSAAAIAPYPQAKELIWAQDEPHNMGALFFVEPHLCRVAKGRKFRSVSRPESASPATGSHQAHVIEQRKILDEVFGG